MGLRERKAQRVRVSIFEAMFELAERNGYDATTIEQVAERAEVAVSTVYRYFANKDAILLAPVSDSASALADALAARPADEEVTVALARTVRSVLDLDPERRRQIRRLRAQLDVAAGPRARLWDVWNQQRALLEQAVADRAPAADPLWVAAAAHITMMVVQMALDHDRESLDQDAPADYADRIIALLRAPNPPFPA